MPEELALLALSDTEWCRQLDTLLAQLPPVTPCAEAPRGEAAFDSLRQALPAPLLDEFAAAVAHPAQIIETAAWRVVVVLRLYAVVIERSTGHVRAAQLYDDGGRTAVAHSWPDTDLLGALQGRLWLRDWLRGWCQRHGVASSTYHLLDEIDQPVSRLRHHACRRLDLRAMRRQVVTAMQYQPLSWRRAVRLTHAVGDRPTQAHYNSALRFAGQLALLEREAPNLVAPWFALAHEGWLDADRKPKAALKQWVCEVTGSSRAWRSLAASPARVWTAWGRCYPGCGTSGIGETARIVRRFGTSRPVPLPLMRAVVERLASVPTVMPTDSAFGYYPAALSAGTAAMASNRWAQFIDELDAVDTWSAATQPTLDKLQSRRGWPWLVRKARDWAETERRRQESGEALIPLLEPLSVGGFTFGAAHTAFDLWNAGRLLGNCLGTGSILEDQARSDSLIVLAVRDSDGRLVAALELGQPRPDGPLQVGYACGVAGTPAPRPLQPLLAQVAAHFERQRLARRLPWRIGKHRSAPTLASVSMPSRLGEGAAELRLTADGGIEIGHWQDDQAERPFREFFAVTRMIRGGRAQRLADRAIAAAAAPVQTDTELARAIATVLAEPLSRDDGWMRFDEGGVSDGDEDLDEFGKPRRVSRPASREAVLEFIDCLARHDSLRARHRMRRVAVQRSRR